jgi:hypothetical protein
MPRIALTSWVRCRTSSSRTDNSIAAACCSADFTGTLAIDGCAAATPIASAHGSGLWPARGQALLRSFSPRLTNSLPRRRSV